MAQTTIGSAPCRVAVVQASPVYLDRAATLDKAADLVRGAAREGARVVVFPESFVPGFPYWPRAYPLPERYRSLEALAMLRDQAVRLHLADLDVVREAARSTNAVVALGITEETQSPSLLYNSIVYIGGRGETLGVHRKLQLTFDEHCVWSAGDATGLGLVDTPAGTLGGLICGNNSLTLAKAAMLLQGEELHASIWPGYRWMWPQTDLVSRGYAVEGRTYVLVASSFLGPQHVPSSHPLRDETPWDIAGGSGIIDPRGRWIAGPLLDEEAVLVAEIDLSESQQLRAVRDAVDSYGRPDLFRLMVNVAPQRLRGVPSSNYPDSDWRVYA